MPHEIILLTGEVEGPHLAAALMAHNPTIHVNHVDGAASLRDALDLTGGADANAGRRLVAFCTGAVVPADVLAALPGPAYNFHPGPPTYPGSRAASFALYEGADRFGATLHVMERRVDEGAIVDVAWFDLPADVKLRYDELEVMSYQRCIGLFQKYAAHLAMDDAPLPLSKETWSGTKRTKADADGLREPPRDATEEEIRRRFRAFGG
ncbi:MAG: methionyl-tRNA formyltransferase [Rhodospirillaceae bacterium]|mgnify:CR=1 FL=1|nr:methionyl-tRNA formyltransferase [Magnetovibrio sp.]MAY68741.1 methionyl-tRNA formyltransferase [Rhodospirillaceae bacterium]